MIFRLLYPHKCPLCRKVLPQKEQILCTKCADNAPEFIRAKRNIPFIAHWTALWYYIDTVRPSIRRFKFYGTSAYAKPYAKLLKEKLDSPHFRQFDILTWVPVSPQRKFHRGYDQAALIARALGDELDFPAQRTLRKIRHTPPQSGIREPAMRRANVLGAFAAYEPDKFTGKRILLIDDVVTTGATAAECARVLLTAGAKEVIFAAVAAAQHDKK